MGIIKEFFVVYFLYRRAGHSHRYCFRTAWSIAVWKTPF